MPPKKRKVEFHYIGEIHYTNPELNIRERTFGRAHEEILKAKRSGKRSIVTLELPNDIVKKLERLRNVEGRIEKEHITQSLGFYIPVEDIAELMKEHKDVKFVGVDLDLYINPNEKNVKKSITLAKRNEFLKKALSEDVLRNLNKDERYFLYTNVVGVVARNEYMTDKIKRIIKSGNYDKIIHIGGSAHSSMVQKIREAVKKDIPGVELKTRIKHTLDKRFKSTVGEMTGKKQINMIFQPHDVFIRSIYGGKLDNLSKDKIIKILKEVNRTKEGAIDDILTLRGISRQKIGNVPEYLEYIAGVTGIDERGRMSVRESPASRIAALLKKIRKKA